MRPCTPMPLAPAPRKSAIKPVPHPAAPVGNPSQTRRHHLTPTPVQRGGAKVPERGQTFFLFHRARRIFFLIRTNMGPPPRPARWGEEAQGSERSFRRRRKRS